MAIAELVVLSSSPRGPTDFAVTPPGAQQAALLSSSSPRLPSPTRLLSRGPLGALSSGPGAAQTPGSAVAGFTIAAASIASERLNLITGNNRVDEDLQVNLSRAGENLEPASTVKTVTKTQRAVKVKNNGETPAKRPRGKKAQTVAGGPERCVADAIVDGSNLANDNAVAAPAAISRAEQDDSITLVNPVKSKKSRTKKQSADPQTKPARAKVTKPRSGPTRKRVTETEEDAASKRKKRTTGVTSEHFTTEVAPEPVQSVQEDSSVVNILTEGLALDEATKRRSDWTPPKDTETAPKTFAFVNLFGNYGYDGTNTDARAGSPVRSVSGEALTKRRRVELIEDALPAVLAPAAENPSIEPAKKVKAVRKKPTTITEVATTAYKAPEPARACTAPVSEFFSPRSQQPGADSIERAGNAPVRKRRVNQKSPSKDDTKAKKATAKSKKKAVVVPPKLLSPESAMRKLDQQDIIFGTSSQLAREESPTFIRDLQQAMRDSEAALGEAERSMAPECDETVRLNTSLAVIKPCRSLWNAGRRNFEGGLLAASKRRRPARLPEPAPVPVEAPPNPKTDSPEFVNIDDINEETVPQPDADGWLVLGEAVVGDKTNSTGHPQDQGGRYGLNVLLDRAQIPEKKVENRQNTSSAEKNVVADTSTAAVSGLQTMSDRRTALQPLPSKINIPVAERIGKPTSEANELLKPARAGAVKAVQGECQAPIQPTTTPDLPAKKPRGRQRKTVSADPTAAPPKRRKPATASKATAPPSTSPQPRKKEWTHIDEIEDSDAESTSSSPNPAILPSISTPLELTTPATSFSQPPPSASKPDKLDWAEFQPTLFALITSTIKSAPRSTDPKRPSWHEKILLYDPIVLEDLTAWLNGQGIKVPAAKGGEEELKPQVVQKWCEEMSVCCLWREGLRGGVKNRY